MAMASLCLGATLLLVAVMIWWNFQQLLQGKSGQDSLGATFLTISKRVTDANMGHASNTLFTQEEIIALADAPGVLDVGRLTANRFPATITLRIATGFTTEVFLESVPDAFIDSKPEYWYWQSTSREVPVILSREFLNLYNYGFALSQNLPRLSESSIKALSFDLIVGRDSIPMFYTARVVGFSDRITSVLVPQAFMDFANRRYGSLQASEAPSRLILKVSDPSDEQFNQYLKQHDYAANSELTRWNKLRAVVDAIAGSMGILALVLLGVSVLGFILFIELTIVRARASLILLLELGYAPRILKQFMLSRYLPMLAFILLLATGIACALQWVAAAVAADYQLQLSPWPGVPVFAVAAFCASSLLIWVSMAVSKAIDKV